MKINNDQDLEMYKWLEPLKGDFGKRETVDGVSEKFVILDFQHS